MPETSIAGTVKGSRILASLIDYALYSFLSGGSFIIFMLVSAREASVLDLLESDVIDLFFSTPSILFNNIQSSAASDGYLWFSAIIIVLVAFLYFSFLPYKWNGQTIGKKLMHIKAVNEAYENPSLRQHILRAVRVYNIYFVVVFLPLGAAVGGLFWLAGTMEIGRQAFLLILNGAMAFGGMLFIVSAFMMVLRDDAKGVHDMVANTMVVPENTPLEAERKTSESKK